MQPHQQHHRQSPRTGTPATNLSTNPERSNNPRDLPPQRRRSSEDLAAYSVRASGRPATMASGSEGARTADTQDKDRTRLNQIISHFHSKAALAICTARASLPQVVLPSGEVKQDRWFNIFLDETDILQEDLQEWKRLDQSENPAPPLQLEIYIDSAQLNSSQALVLLDDSGKRWDVADALCSSADSSPQLTKNGARYCEVVLERWTIQLGDARGFAADDLNDALPNIYKKGVVFFRSLQTFLRLLPTWKLYRKLSRQAGSHQALRLKFRLKPGPTSSRARKDTLYTPLCSSEQRGQTMIERHEFHPLLTPSGPLRCSVEYRQNCSFSVTDAESLLSSRFLGLEEGIPTLAAGRSLPSSHTDRARERYSQTVTGGGEMPARDKPRGLLGAYGSLGTFHATDKAGSPVSELRQRAEQADEEDDEPTGRRIRGATTSSSARRVSMSLRDNPPFKAGSLASSPKPSPRPSPSPSTSAGKYESSFQRPVTNQSLESSRRIPLSARPSPLQSRAASSIPNETAVASSGSTSPRPPAPVKYSSSFANRHKRLASQGGSGSKTADSPASSARGSSSSKEKSGQFGETTAGAGVAAPARGGPSSSTTTTAGGKSDDDDIAAFISQIETANKEFKAFRPSSASSSRAGGGSGSAGGGSGTAGSQETSHHVVNLAKYTSLRETNAQLADEMSSSSLLLGGGQQQHLIGSSTTPPSRRLSNVPGLSTSSSPSRAQPHVPFVRSRLSTHSIAEEAPGSGSAGGGGAGSSVSAVGGNSRDGLDSPTVREPNVEEEEEDDEPFIFQQDNV